MLVHSHINPLFNSVSYFFDGVLIDPGEIWDGFKNTTTVLLTHAHFDHIYGLNEVFAFSPSTKVYTNKAGRDMLLNARYNLSYYHETPFVFEHPEAIIVVNENDIVFIDEEISARAVFTPGHNPSCVSWVIDNAIFTGDSYIPGIKTITNLPKGNAEDAKKSVDLILKLSHKCRIYPGHDISKIK